MRAAARLMAASDPWRRLGLTAKHCLKAFKVPYRETWLAVSGGAIAGLVTITMYGTFRGYIQSLFVAPGFRGEGAGAQAATPSAGQPRAGPPWGPAGGSRVSCCATRRPAEAWPAPTLRATLDR